ncbi:MAG TPA: NAD-binding protein, partial [Candidatus Paceibacterota bacterium]|nr:NAD-binding protein [Candidatus Paceibacterota bacterium]
MSGKFVDILFSWVITLRWKWIILWFLVFFAGSWWATYYFDPTCKVASPSVFWWYFITTIIRAGYPEYFPTGLGSRITLILMFFIGGVFLIVPICKAASMVFEHSQRRKKGLAMLNVKNHAVLLGYRAGETETIVEQLLADHLHRKKFSSVVICSKKITEAPPQLAGNPLVSFVQGDTASDDVIERACVKDACLVLVTGHEDARTMAVCLAINNVVRKDAHVVAYIEDRKNAALLHKLNPSIECVMSLRPMLIAQAAVNPGSSEVIRDLVDLKGIQTIFRINVPDWVPAMDYWVASKIMRHCYDAIPFALANDHSPDSPLMADPQPKTIVKGGMAIFYIGKGRVDKDIDWSMFKAGIRIEGLPDDVAPEVQES